MSNIVYTAQYSRFRALSDTPLRSVRNDMRAGKHRALLLSFFCQICQRIT